MPISDSCKIIACIPPYADSSAQFNTRKYRLKGYHYWYFYRDNFSFEWERYKKIGYVMHPYERFLACYNKSREGILYHENHNGKNNNGTQNNGTRNNGKTNNGIHSDCVVARNTSLKEFVRLIVDRSPDLTHPCWHPQNNWLADNGFLMIDEFVQTGLNLNTLTTGNDDSIGDGNSGNYAAASIETIETLGDEIISLLNDHYHLDYNLFNFTKKQTAPTYPGKQFEKYTVSKPVSVVITSKNKEKEIPYVVNALAHQSRRPDFVVLSDDASTDNTCDEFIKHCDIHRLKAEVLVHPDEGVPFRQNSLRNQGARWCPDGLVLLIDADIVLPPHCIEKHVEIHQGHEDGRIISSGPRLEYARNDCTGPINYLWGMECVGSFESPQTEKYPRFPHWHQINTYMMAISKSTIEGLGWFDERYNGHWGCEDIDFSYRAYQLGFRFASVWETYGIHIPHPRALITPDTSHNRWVFHNKNGIDIVYHEILQTLSHDPWNEYYEILMKSPLEAVARMNNYIRWDTIPTFVLMSKLGRRILNYIVRFFYFIYIKGRSVV